MAEHRIYVGGLDQNVEGWELQHAFQRFGEIMSIEVLERRRYGFVSFCHKRAAERAIEEMDGECLDGRYEAMRVEWAHGWPIESSEDYDNEYDDFYAVFNETDSDNTTVYCGGLTDITSYLLEQTFLPYGNIEEITCFNDSRNYAFVRFETKGAATRAICSLNDTYVDGDLVTVSWARNPQVRGAAPSTSSESSESSASSHSSPIPQDSFDTVMSKTTPDNRTIYIGGLGSDVREYMLYNEFIPYGDVEHINLLHNYAFIRFTTKVSAALAICACNEEFFINGSKVRANWAHRTVEDEALLPSASATPSPLPTQSEPTVLVSGVAIQSEPTVLVSGVAIQSEPTVLVSGVAIVSEPEQTEPIGATSAKETKPTKQVKFEELEGGEKKVYDLQCKICMDKDVGVVFLPCGHLASCPLCAQKISNCPMCRKRITGKVRTYLS